MSCRCLGLQGTADPNVVVVSVAHCSGDVLLFQLDPRKYPDAVGRAASYLQLCYVHEPECNFKKFTV